MPLFKNRKQEPEPLTTPENEFPPLPALEEPPLHECTKMILDAHELIKKAVEHYNRNPPKQEGLQELHNATKATGNEISKYYELVNFDKLEADHIQQYREKNAELRKKIQTDEEENDE